MLTIHLIFQMEKLNTPSQYFITFVKMSFSNIKIQHKQIISHHKPLKAYSVTLELSELDFKSETYSSSLTVAVMIFSYFPSSIGSLYILFLFLNFNLSCFYCY